MSVKSMPQLFSTTKANTQLNNTGRLAPQTCSQGYYMLHQLTNMCVKKPNIYIAIYISNIIPLIKKSNFCKHTIVLRFLFNFPDFLYNT